MLPNTEYVVVIGTGGLASAYNANAGDGLASSFGTLTCQGGKGGKASAAAGEPGGTGGTRGQNGAYIAISQSPPPTLSMVGTSGGRNVSGGYGNGGNGGGASSVSNEPGQNGDNGICIVEW